MTTREQLNKIATNVHAEAVKGWVTDCLELCKREAIKGLFETEVNIDMFPTPIVKDIQSILNDQYDIHSLYISRDVDKKFPASLVVKWE